MFLSETWQAFVLTMRPGLHLLLLPRRCGQWESHVLQAKHQTVEMSIVTLPPDVLEQRR